MLKQLVQFAHQHGPKWLVLDPSVTPVNERMPFQYTSEGETGLSPDAMTRRHFIGRTALHIEYDITELFRHHR